MQRAKTRLKGMNGAAVDSIILTFIQVVTTAVGLIVSKILSVNFSLIEYGTYSQVMLIVTTASSLTILGMTNAVNYFFNGNASYDEKQKYLGTLFDIQYVLGIFCALLLMLLRDPISVYFKNDQLRGILWVAACLPALQNLLPMMQVLFVATGRAKLIAVRNFLISIARLVFVLIASYITKSIDTIIVLLLVLDIVQIGCFRLLLRKNRINIRIRDFDYRKIKEIFVFCLPMAVYLMTNSLSRDIDKYVVSYFADTEMLAIYSNASKVLPFDLVTASFITVLIPIITRQVRSEDYAQALCSFKAYLRLGYIATWILAFGAVILSKDLMLFLYDAKYLPGLAVFVVYLFVDMIKFANTSLILVAKGKTKTLMYTSVAALLGNALLNIPAYKAFGIIGPAVTTLFITMALVSVLLIISARELKSCVSELFNWKEMLLITIELVLVGIGIFVLSRVLEEYISSSTILLIICYGLYLIILLALNWKRLLSCLKEINQLR